MRVRVAHLSLQFSDSDAEHTHDLEKLFDRANERKYGWITGTEAGPGSGNMSKQLVTIGREHGYRMYVPAAKKGPGWASDGWIAVRESLIKSGWKASYEPVIPGSQELYKAEGVDEDLLPRWGPRGLAKVSFKSLPQLGEINIAATHHLTQGQKNGPESVIHGVDHFEWNRKLDQELGKWMHEVATGSSLAFAAMDRNASDRRSTIEIPGGTTLADELKAWQNSGHGDIDWIVSYNKDGRVTGVRFVVYNDRQFHLFGDHHLLEGLYSIEALKI